MLYIEKNRIFNEYKVVRDEYNAFYRCKISIDEGKVPEVSPVLTVVSPARITELFLEATNQVGRL